MRTQVIVVVARRGDDLTSFPKSQEDVLINEPSLRISLPITLFVIFAICRWEPSILLSGKRSTAA
jgi:hypothetical protein